ncbi:transcription factor RFX3 [Achroia grisella]|uniref:transcription factor RFX3 n=1 Tax=Achroia grisella TaxID=688607 RepID=UPI0027D27CF4|nr:transcription factor RFX3 [Achroia grisella]
MSEMGFENVFYLENFECAGDEVLVESSPPASPNMAARLAGPTQGAGTGGGASPNTVRELIVIPEIPNSIHLQHAIQQVSNTVVEVNGDSSGHSSPTADAQHTYITVSMQGAWNQPVEPQLVKAEQQSDQESKCEGGNGVNYHVQYVEPQDIYTQNHQPQMEQLRSYPVYGVATVGGATDAADGWPPAAGYTAYGVVVAGEDAEVEAEGEAAASPPSPGAAAAAGGVAPPRMPPATVQWLLDNYETAEGVSLPRSTLYSHYLRHCSAHRLEPVNAASFGKLIRSVFVGLRTRRLGTRGNSKYHYYGIRAKHLQHAADAADDDDKAELTEQESREPESQSSPAATVGAGAGGAGGAGAGAGAAAGGALAGIAHRQYLGAAVAPDPPDLLLHSMPDAAPALRDHYRSYGAEFLEAAAALEAGAAERARRSFWRRAAASLGRRALRRLASRREFAAWLLRADLRLHQCTVDMLMPDVLRPIPPQLTQAIRNFAKSVESALVAGSAGAGGAEGRAGRAGAAAAAALAAALRRYTSLNHLAQAARAVLTNHNQIQQMVSDLSRVDFRVVREQAAWACSCGRAEASSAGSAARLEAEFKATLARGAALEQWALWLDGCVRAALAPHERRADFELRARRLLLDWSFYSSLVIRELTLRSAASFGSFHLIRLLYDEYVSYVIERRVAAFHDTPPIAVMQRLPEEDDDGSEEKESSHEDEEDDDWDWEDEDEEDEEPEAKRTKLH